MKPKVSIILPVYNGEKFISETIQSLIDQTYPNFEIVIGIDGTHDKSYEIINGFDDFRIRVFQNNHNLGLGANLNRLISLTNPDTEYIAMAEQDDIYSPTRLEKQVEVLDKRTYFGMVSGIAEFWNPDKKGDGHLFPGILAFEKEYPKGIEMFLLNFINQIKVVNSCMMFRKSVHYDNGLFFNSALPSISVDWDYILRFCLKSDIYGIPEVLVKLRRSSSHKSLTSDKHRVFRANHYLINSIRFQFPEIVTNSVFKASLSTQHIFEIKNKAGVSKLISFAINYLKNPKDKRWGPLLKQILKRFFRNRL
jgi:glycosyltransferase involved in cell wall biosynthesis